MSLHSMSNGERSHHGKIGGLYMYMLELHEESFGGVPESRKWVEPMHPWATKRPACMCIVCILEAFRLVLDWWTIHSTCMLQTTLFQIK